MASILNVDKIRRAADTDALVIDITELHVTVDQRFQL